MISTNILGASDHEDIDIRDMSNRTAAILAGSLRLEALDARLRLLKRGANGLIYASVLLGVALLAQLYVLIAPSWLLYSILAGWAFYLVVAVGVATGREKAYPPALCHLNRDFGCFSPTTRTLLSR